MKVFKGLFCLALVAGFGVVGAQSASAATLFVDCTSPGLDVAPPASGSFGPSVCDALAPLPVGAVVTDISLLARYSVSLELGGAVGTADFGHTTNVGVTDFDNGGVSTPTTASQPFTDVTIGPIACPSAACTAALSSLLAGTVNVTTWVDNPTGQTSSVSSDYRWAINYEVRQVPEPTSMALLGMSMIGLGFARRRRS